MLQKRRKKKKGPLKKSQKGNFGKKTRARKAKGIKGGRRQRVEVDREVCSVVKFEKRTKKKVWTTLTKEGR